MRGYAFPSFDAGLLRGNFAEKLQRMRLKVNLA